MDIKQMKYFLEICKHGSISHAAESLFISQQGLSSAVRRLESELHCDLFYRKSNSMVLTDQGKFFLEQASSIVSEFDKLQNHFLFSGGSDNHISVICVYNIISKSPLALQRLLLDNTSGIEISIGECYSSDCAQYLENDECNFAISYDIDDWGSQFEVIPLFWVEHCFIVHRSNPLAQLNEIPIEQLQGARMIFPAQRTAIRAKLDQLFEEHHIHPLIVFQTNQALQIYNLVANDHSLVARVTVADAEAINNPEFKLLRLRDVNVSTNVVLVHRCDRQLSLAERAFRQDVLAAVKAT